MTKPEERGTRGTGSDEPSGGPVDRPSGALEGDKTVPTYGGKGDADFESGFTNEPPKDVEPAVPPYEGRQTEAKPSDGSDESGERTGGAVKPVGGDTDYKAPAPADTPGGATASPADEQPASQMPESDRDDDRVAGPSHTAGTGRGEDKR
jgi:hypothetical protein